jgi:quinol monooxygenase YgiN
MGLAGFAEVTSSLRGCLACRLYRAAAGAPELLYLEMWEDWPSLEAHVGSSNFRRLLKFMELSAQPPELMFSEAADCRGLEFVERIRGARPGCGGHTRSPEGDTL